MSPEQRSAKRVRAYRAGAVVVDSRAPHLVWEWPFYPTYWFDPGDVRADRVPDGASRTDERGRVRIEWSAMDEWFEEDEPVYVHPRDPGVRVDVLAGSRHVVAALDGVTILDSHQPRILFETRLPPRYYVPLTDLRLDLMTPSDTVSHCPYKGTATYWSIGEHADVVWTYRAPLPESAKIAGLASVYTEVVDLWIDGEAQERPRTHFRTP